MFLNFHRFYLNLSGLSIVAQIWTSNFILALCVGFEFIIKQKITYSEIPASHLRLLHFNFQSIDRFKAGLHLEAILVNWHPPYIP